MSIHRSANPRRGTRRIAWAVLLVALGAGAVHLTKNVSNVVSAAAASTTVRLTRADPTEASRNDARRATAHDGTWAADQSSSGTRPDAAH